jgi:hypothetical protein
MMAVVGVTGWPVWAQFGVPSKPPTASGGGATAEEIDKFLSSAVKADELVQESQMHLLKAVASKQDADKFEAQMKEAKAIQDPKERQAKLDVVNANVNTFLQKVDYQQVTNELKAKHDTKKNRAIANGLWNLGLGGLKDAELVSSGKKLASGTPRPEIATKISEVKQAVERLARQGEGVTKILGSAKTLMSTVGLENLPTSSTEPPKVVDDV